MNNTLSKVIIHSSAYYAPLLIPIFFWIFIKDDEVKRLAGQAFLFQITISALIWLSILLVVILIGIPLIILFSMMAIFVPIIGIVKALNGSDWEYPIVKNWI